MNDVNWCERDSVIYYYTEVGYINWNLKKETFNKEGKKNVFYHTMVSKTKQVKLSYWHAKTQLDNVRWKINQALLNRMTKKFLIRLYMWRSKLYLLKGVLILSCKHSLKRGNVNFYVGKRSLLKLCEALCLYS